jgi:hypothetical protein
MDIDTENLSGTKLLELFDQLESKKMTLYSSPSVIVWTEEELAELDRDRYVVAQAILSRFRNINSFRQPMTFPDIRQAWTEEQIKQFEPLLDSYTTSYSGATAIEIIKLLKSHIKNLSDFMLH